MINAGVSLNVLSFTETLGLFTAPVVRKVDSAINWINHFPKDTAIGFRLYLLLVTVNAALDHFLQKGCQQQRAHGGERSHRWKESLRNYCKHATFLPDVSEG